MAEMSKYALDTQDRSVREYMAVRDAGGDTDQLFLYPPGSTEKEKTKIWKERKKAEKEAEKRRKNQVKSGLHDHDVKGEEAAVGYAEESVDGEKIMQFRNEIDEDKKPKDTRLKRMMQRLSRNEKPENIIR